MASSYPGALDALTNPVAGDMQNSPSHSGQHTNANDAIEAIQGELGTDPSGASATVKARLTAMDAVDALRVVGSNATTAPSSPVVGQVWVDHSTPASPVIKVWSGSAWVNPSSAGSGGAALVWATVTGGTVTTVVNPDGSTDEVHRFTSSSTLVVSASGYAEVLLVGGGGATDTGGAQGGDGGDVIRGLFTLPAGSHAVTVGAAGTWDGNTAANNRSSGGKSSIGTLLETTFGGRTWDGAGVGAGGTVADPTLGVTSSITGTAVEYGKASTTASPPANSGWGTNYPTPAAGVVIVRVKVTPAPALPAATGWAQVTGGTVTEYTKPDGSVMEVHTFTAAGSLTVVAAGYAETLIVGGGGGAMTGAGLNGDGGTVDDGLRALPAGSLAVVVGAGGAISAAIDTASGGPSSLGSIIAPGGGPGYVAGGATTAALPGRAIPHTSSITGTAQEYARVVDSVNYGGTSRVNFGDGGWQGGSKVGTSGIVIVAVQKTPPTASGVVATGGTETTFTGDGTNGVLGQGYKVHRFTASGSLVVSAAPAGSVVDVLLIGGGGSGSTGGNYGGGGSPGQVVALTGYPISAGTLAVVVGAGMAASSSEDLQGAGGISALGSLTAAGGRSTKTNGALSPNGFAGGAGVAAAGGGGGGSGGAGVAANGGTNAGGAGGAGTVTTITGTAQTLAGGGGGSGISPNPGAGTAGGGTGGTGGGGSANGSAATANTGGGGGGAVNATSGAGGSGVVIVRYKV